MGGCTSRDDTSAPKEHVAKGVNPEINVKTTTIQKERPAVPESTGGKQQLPPDTCIIFVLGGPACGKGTQCERIVAAYGFQHLSAGDLLREEVGSGSERAEQLKQIMREGGLVPDDLMVALLKAAMLKSGANAFLVDGFPRSIPQAEVFENLVKAPSAVLFYDCPEEVMKERLMKRAESSGRDDDNAETAVKRFKTFLQHSLPVKALYEERGLCAVITATAGVDEVFEQTKQALTRLLPSKLPKPTESGGQPSVEDRAPKGPATDESLVLSPAVEDEAAATEPVAAPNADPIKTAALALDFGK